MALTSVNCSRVRAAQADSAGGLCRPIHALGQRDVLTGGEPQGGTHAGRHVAARRSDQTLLAADFVLVASGTAALEAMLAKRPMVVAYKVAPLTYRIVTWFKLMRTTRYSLPNVLAGRDLVPEILQDACTPQALADALLALYADSAGRVALVAEFERLHRTLIGDANRSAAAAVAALVEDGGAH